MCPSSYESTSKETELLGMGPTFEPLLVEDPRDSARQTMSIEWIVPSRYPEELPFDVPPGIRAFSPRRRPQHWRQPAAPNATDTPESTQRGISDLHELLADVLAREQAH